MLEVPASTNFQPTDEPGSTARRKENRPKWGKGRRILMYPSQKFEQKTASTMIKGAVFDLSK